MPKIASQIFVKFRHISERVASAPAVYTFLACETKVFFVFVTIPSFFMPAIGIEPITYALRVNKLYLYKSKL
ncbi:MAG TPA: hypothetical protein K8V64_08895 [Enterococcus durans]|nr:hypothetical protein [Enterococcus durans]